MAIYEGYDGDHGDQTSSFISVSRPGLSSFLVSTTSCQPLHAAVPATILSWIEGGNERLDIVEWCNNQLNVYTSTDQGETFTKSVLTQYNAVNLASFSLGKDSATVAVTDTDGFVNEIRWSKVVHGWVPGGRFDINGGSPLSAVRGLSLMPFQRTGYPYLVGQYVEGPNIRNATLLEDSSGATYIGGKWLSTPDPGQYAIASCVEIPKPSTPSITPSMPAMGKHGFYLATLLLGLAGFGTASRLRVRSTSTRA